MSLDSLSFFKTASQRMQWLGERQKVISENVANSDTPGYKAKEVSSFSAMLDVKRQAGLATTDPKHISGARSTGETGNITVVQDKQTWGESLTGNTVVLEQQTIKANEISENYRLAARLYRKGYDLLTIAATGLR